MATAAKPSELLRALPLPVVGGAVVADGALGATGTEVLLGTAIDVANDPPGRVRGAVPAGEVTNEGAIETVETGACGCPSEIWLMGTGATVAVGAWGCPSEIWLMGTGATVAVGAWGCPSEI